MARNYAALPHEYLEEMEALSDAEFGRLCRALLKYSMTGEEEQLQGAERLLIKRVILQERRYQESYKEITESRREAGKKGAAKRWHSIASDSKAIASDSKAIASDSKNGYTETKTKTNTLPSKDGEDTRARDADPGLAWVMAEYMDRIDANPSPTSMGELKGYVERLGPEVCLQAVYEAIDAGAQKWTYVKAILRNCEKDGIRSLADWSKRKAEREQRSKPSAKPKAKACSDYSAKDTADRLRRDMEELERLARGGES